MNVSGISLKEAMEAVEERIPYGRRVVTLLLTLMILAIGVILCKFLYSNLVFPVMAWAASWWATPLPIRFEAAPIAEVVVSLIVGGIIVGSVMFAGNYFANRINLAIGLMEEMMKDVRIGEFTAKGKDLIDTLNIVYDKLDALAERVSQLENRDSPQ